MLNSSSINENRTYKESEKKSGYRKIIFIVMPEESL